LADYVAVNTMVNPSNYVAVGSITTATNDGNYIVFKNLKASTIVVEADTADGLGTGNNPRAPINAIQLVTPSGLTGGGGGGSTISISLSGGSVTISSSNGGTVQATSSLTPPVTWQDLGPAPQTVTATGNARFFRVQN
jgi:hypothetical protein